MNGLTEFLSGFPSPYEIVDIRQAKSIYKPRDPFANKGTYGHALLIAGSYGKMGAAVLSARACLHAGVGLLTSHVPISGYSIIQTAVPEAMVTIDADQEIPTKITDDPGKYSVIGIGPGMGTDPKTSELLDFIFSKYKNPMVVDADALNLLAKNPDLLAKIPAQSILTPHPKEFDRLFGDQPTSFARFDTAIKQAVRLKCTVVVKGHYTAIASPDGRISFNSTGNAGMAKGGSGDVLTGIITGLLAQRYQPVEAAILGIYLHGLAGDLASKQYSQEAMLPSDLINCIGKGYFLLV